MSLSAALLKALRPHQWVKNLLVLAPLVFAHRVGDTTSVLRALGAFVVFCCVASAVYLFNDIRDVDADRRHPTKRDRPIASGALPLGVARLAAAVLVALGLGVAWLLGTGTADGRADEVLTLPFVTWPLAYLLLNLAYSLRLKHVVILDAVCIALGFVLRVFAGSEVLPGVEPSSWILLCTFFIALFLAFCKRREEVASLGSSGATRKTTKDYDLPFLDMLIAPLAAMAILSYALYTVAPDTVATHGTKNLQFTVPFAVFGVFRYLFLVYRRGEGADPSKLLFTDRQIVLAGVLWAVAVWAALESAPGRAG